MRVAGICAATIALQLCTPGLVKAQDPCPEGTLWEPYGAECAEVRDMRAWFLPSLSQSSDGTGLASSAEASEPDYPVPGSIAAGITYAQNQLVAVESGRLHTRMFVYPDGLETSGDLPLMYTTATARVHRGLELLGAYRELGGQTVAQLALYAWPCLPDYPCPDGDTSPGWQFWIDFVQLSCNITNAVDQGGHAQRVLYYANHSDKVDDASPPEWRSAAYLWNYCDGAWDLAWEHTYRQDKADCSVPGSGCGWWGPGFEIFDGNYPMISELGYEDSLLYHDGVWSELRPGEAQFRDPAIFAPAPKTPWGLLHIDPNRSFGAGNFVDPNDAPVIEGQEPVSGIENEPITLSVNVLQIHDPDADLRFHVENRLTLYGGANYTFIDQTVTPSPHFTGTLEVPVTVSDGMAESAPFALRIDVQPADDAPPILKLRGPRIRKIKLGGAYRDLGAIAFDRVDGKISDRIVTNDPVNPNVAGTYIVTYSVTDSAGNTVSIERTVVVSSRGHGGWREYAHGLVVECLRRLGLRL